MKEWEYAKLCEELCKPFIRCWSIYECNCGCVFMVFDSGAWGGITCPKCENHQVFFIDLKKYPREVDQQTHMLTWKIHSVGCTDYPADQVNDRGKIVILDELISGKV